jgi:hypothetical protein
VLPIVIGVVVLYSTPRLFPSNIFPSVVPYKPPQPVSLEALHRFFSGRSFSALQPQPCNDVEYLRYFLHWVAEGGVFAVTAGVLSFIQAAAVLAYRFEISDVNGTWSYPYVLRQKLHTLLTLFFIGSIMLVSYNVAVSSAMDWLKELVENADKIIGSSSAKSQADNAITIFTTLQASLKNFSGGLGSLVLVVIFAPAFYALSSDIMVASRCHGSDSPEPRTEVAGVSKSPQGYFVANWETMEAWRTKYGLKLSFTDWTSSLVAVLAPLLTGSLVDLTKLVQH